LLKADPAKLRPPERSHQGRANAKLLGYERVETENKKMNDGKFNNPPPKITGIKAIELGTTAKRIFQNLHELVAKARAKPHQNALGLYRPAVPRPRHACAATACADEIGVRPRVLRDVAKTDASLR